MTISPFSINKPTRQCDDYPEMPPKKYLSEHARRAAAEYMLQVKRQSQQRPGMSENG
jgi:hypothetical protein